MLRLGARRALAATSSSSSASSDAHSAIHQQHPCRSITINAQATSMVTTMTPSNIGQHTLIEDGRSSMLTRSMLKKLSIACNRSISTSTSTNVLRSMLVSRTELKPLQIPKRVIVPFMPVRYVTGGTRVRENTKTNTSTPLTTAYPPSAKPAPPTMSMPAFTQTSQTSDGIAEPAGPSTAEVVLGNVGLSDYLGRVYRTTGLSVGASLAISYGLGSLGLLSAASAGTWFIAGSVVSIGSLLGLMFGKKPVTHRRAEDHTKLYTENSTLRKTLYGTFIGGNAAAMSPLIIAVNAINPLIVPAAVGATTLTMAGASWYAYKKPDGSLLSLAAPLTGALFGLIGMNLASAGALYFVGPNAFSAAMMTAYPYIGIGVFSALTAFDTHNAIAEYKAGSADHLSHAVSFYLNFINLLMDFIQIFARRD